MSDEHDSWFMDAFGVDLGGAAKRLEAEAQAAAAQVTSVVQTAQGAVEETVGDAVGAVTGVAKQVAAVAGFEGGGGGSPQEAAPAGIQFPSLGDFDLVGNLEKAANQVIAQNAPKLPLLKRSEALLSEASGILDSNAAPNTSLQLPPPSTKFKGACCSVDELKDFRGGLDSPRISLQGAINAFNDAERGVIEACEQGKQICLGSLGAGIIGTLIAPGGGGAVAAFAACVTCIGGAFPVQNAIRAQAKAEEDLKVANGAMERALSNHRNCFVNRCDRGQVEPPQPKPKPKPGPQPKPSPQPKPPSGPTGSQLLKEGSSGPDVKEVQLQLNKKGASLNPDGIFGPKTTTAVKDFQTKVGLKNDGIVGPKTRAALSAGNQVPPKPTPVLGKTVVIVTNQDTNDAIGKANVKIGDQQELTGNTGQATFSLPAGSHSFEVEAKGFQKGAGRFNVREDGDTDVHVELKPAGNASGSVIFSVVNETNKKPVAGATIKIGKETSQTANTGFVVIFMPAGTFDFEVSAQGFETARGKIEITDDEGRHVELLKPKGGGKTGSISVSVVNAVTNKGIEGAIVDINGETLQTGNTGLAVFFMPPGNFPFKVIAKGFENGGGGTVEVTEAGSSFIEFMQPKDSPAEGSVIFSVVNETNNKPVAGATVKIGKETSQTANTGFVVIFMPAGTFDFEVTAQGFETARGKIEITDDEGRHIELLKPKGGGGKTGSISVSVVDAVTNKGIEGATVDINGETLETGNTGLAVFFMPPGNFPFKVTAKGFENGGGGTIEVTEEGSSFVEFMQPKGGGKTGSISVSVVNAVTNKGIEGATVDINGETLETGNTGLAVFFMPPGNFPFTVTAKGFENGGGGTIEVTEEGSSFVEFMQPKDPPATK